MTDLSLPHPAGALPLPLTLQLVKDLEHTGGSLFKIADMLLAKELPLGDVIRLLQTAYRTAGCVLSAQELGAYLLKQNPVMLLTDILVGLLTPLHELSAVRDETD